MAHIARVSAVQLPTVVAARSFAEKQRKNRRQICRMLTVAGNRKSDLVLFGEYANLHHRTWSRNLREYVPDAIPGRFTRLIATYAKKYRMYVAMPMFGVFEGNLSSWVVIFDRSGRILGCYQKAHPTVSEQRLGIIAGNDLPVYPLDFGKIGIMTCMDIEYPEVALVLMLKKADLLLFPHVQGSWGELDWEIRYRTRAIDTGLYLVSACYGYPEGEWQPGKMIGRTGVVGCDGLILGDMGRSIGVLTVDVDLRQKRVTEFYFESKVERTLGIVASRRPDIYAELVDPSTKAAALRRLGIRARPWPRRRS